VPRIPGELSSQSVGQGFQTGGEHLANIRGREQPVDIAFLMTIDSRAKSLRRDKTIQ
jgi:hypothetical protein